MKYDMLLPDMDVVSDRLDLMHCDISVFTEH